MSGLPRRAICFGDSKHTVFNGAGMTGHDELSVAVHVPYTAAIEIEAIKVINAYTKRNGCDNNLLGPDSVGSHTTLCCQLAACIVRRFIRCYTYLELAAFLDNTPRIASALRAISFQSRPIIATSIIIELINSDHCMAFMTVLMPKRAPGIVHVVANQMSAPERAAFVRDCLVSMTPSTADLAVPHLIAFLADHTWYMHRGSVLDGCRPWKLWRHITSVNTPMCHETRWKAIRAIVSTCPGRVSEKGRANSLADHADKQAIRILLDPPNPSWLTDGIALATKVNSKLISVAALSPYSPVACQCYRALFSEAQVQPPGTAQPVFTWHPPDVRPVNTDFLLLLARQDHRNGCLLQLPSGIMSDQEVLVQYCNLIGHFASIIHNGPGERHSKRWVIHSGQSVVPTAFMFATCALVGIYALTKNIFQTIHNFFTFSKYVVIGDGASLWTLMWQTHYTTKCMAQTIGIETALGGTISEHNRAFKNICPSRIFVWMHDVARVFSNNPYIELAACSGSRHTLSNLDQKRATALFMGSIELHRRHPDIGPNGGFYVRPENPKAVIQSMGKCSPALVRRYVLDWLMPKFLALNEQSAWGGYQALRYRVPTYRKQQIAAWLAGTVRVTTAGGPKTRVPALNRDVVHMIIALCI